LVFREGAEIANTSLTGIQKSGLHSYIENAQSNYKTDQEKEGDNTPIFSIQPMRKGEDPCRGQMNTFV
jgi:hypothetical protein